jgi:hypothetical protein
MAGNVAQGVVVQVAQVQVLLSGDVDTMKRHRHVELLGRSPEGVVILVVPGPCVDRVIRQEQRDGAQFLHGASGLGDRFVHIVYGHLGAHFEALQIGTAEIVRPFVIGAANSGGQRAVYAVVGVKAEYMGALGAEDYGDINALYLHGRQHVLRLITAAGSRTGEGGTTALNGFLPGFCSANLACFLVTGEAFNGVASQRLVGHYKAPGAVPVGAEQA